MSVAEGEREGGISPNVISFPHISDFGNVLHKLNFKLPSFSVYKYRYKFEDMGQLFEFLECIGETNFLKNRRNFKKRETFISTMALYHSIYNNTRKDEDFSDIRIIEIDLRENKTQEFFIFSTIEVGSFICWKYHPSQPESKPRGSAEINLKDIASEVLDSETEISFGTIKQKEGGAIEDYEILDMTEIIKERIRKKLGDDVLNEKLEKFNNDTSCKT